VAARRITVKPVRSICLTPISAEGFEDREACLRGRRRPSLVQFRVTESLLMSDPEGRGANAAGTEGLRREDFSVDDFAPATRVSPTQALSDRCAQDRPSFVRDITHRPEDAMITPRSWLWLTALKLKVVGRGVETRSSSSARRQRCDEIQGYHSRCRTTPTSAPGSEGIRINSPGTSPSRPQ